MPKPQNFDKVTLNLRKGDWDELTEFCQNRPTNPSTIVRTIVSRFVDDLKPNIPRDKLPTVGL